MKQHVLLATALCMVFSATAQDRSVSNQIKDNAKYSQATAVEQVVPGPVQPAAKKGSGPAVAGATVCVTPIGNSANALTCAFGQRTNLSVRPDLNTMVFIHRNDPGVTGAGISGDYYFDMSTDGGATWTSNVGPIYDGNTSLSAGRYPQCVLYNPSGNTTPGNMYISYYGPSLTGTNGSSWGGIANGAFKLDQSAAAWMTEDTVQYFGTGDGSTVTQDGTFWVVDVLVDLVGNVYTGDVMVTKGTWSTDHYALTRSFIAVPNTGLTSEFVTASIAFAPNSMDGYISVLCHPDFTNHPDSVYVPYIYKTTDGGATWNALGSISLAGISPLLMSLSPISAAFEMDSEVDANGNLHMTFGCHYSPSGYSISTVKDEFGIFDIYTTDGGTTWYAQPIGNPEFYSGLYGAGDNAPGWNETTRPQVTRTWAGDVLFFCYFDTDPNIGTENTYPDMHCVGYNATTNFWTANLNLSTGTAADASMQMSNVGNYVLGTSGTYTIPVVYQAVADPQFVLPPTQHNYVCSLEVNDAQFTVAGLPILLTFFPVGVSENVKPISLVGVNVPNPFSVETRIEITLASASHVTIDITNLQGQLVKQIDAGRLNAGANSVTIKREGLEAGTYFYTVKSGGSAITNKMVVQ